ncbi:hypothetical protein [Williamsia sterculiae]|uniref:Uncharacterized protein n=1 Tax=Williamsia sterculiae TaxID=1344003 RepID=A0A1N7EP28_9NOCA|nr:hypothetical protein [Williamsia sterculiae]SIR89789.1 hypothetical protein SAMN05445060_1512 [Williamsia sterculiae]
MTTADRLGTRKPYACAWCGREIVDSGSGRRRRYCKQACRQRAYESRSSGDTSVPDDAVVLSSHQATDLRDRLFALRCGVEDLDTALREGAEHDELTAMSRDLLSMAREAERLR